MPSKPAPGKKSARKKSVQSAEKESPMPMGVAVTGNIGSGKSTAVKFFAELGVPTLDTDRIGHELLESDARIRAAIAKIFGGGIVKEDQIDRRKLGELVFNNEEKRVKLESLLHPAIMAAVSERASEFADKKYVIVEVPLLYEAELADKFDYVILVKADENEAVARASVKLGIEREEVFRRLDTQIHQSEKEKLADFVIANNGSQEDLRAKVVLLHSVISSLKPDRD